MLPFFYDLYFVILAALCTCSVYELIDRMGALSCIVISTGSPKTSSLFSLMSFKIDAVSQ